MTLADNEFWLNTFERHGSAVMAFLTSRVGRRDVAEDLLQETFVRAIRAVGAMPDRTNVRSYLFTTAHHLIISQARRKRPVLFSEAAESESRFLDSKADEQAPSPDSTTDLLRLKSRLEDVLQTLSPSHRVAFELAVLQQMPYAEVAEAQGWTLAQVKANVHRARKKVILAMRDLIGPDQESAS